MDPATPLEGWLEIRGLRCSGRHGAYAGEQDVVRIFLVDVAVRADIGRPAATDRLEDALDFAELAATVRRVVGGAPRALLESLAVAVAREVLAALPAASATRVRVVKPNPDGLDAAEESVTVSVSSAHLRSL
jgi:dihydroneopterin aldolase